MSIGRGSFSHIVQMIGCNLIYFIIQPVGKQKIGVRFPLEKRDTGRLVVREIAYRNSRMDAFGQIPGILVSQGRSAVFRMSCHKQTMPLSVVNQIDASHIRFCQDIQFPMALYLFLQNAGIAGMRRMEDVVKSPC